jgi:chromosomal replication initiation ATPase DnaA
MQLGEFSMRAASTATANAENCIVVRLDGKPVYLTRLAARQLYGDLVAALAPPTKIETDTQTLVDAASEAFQVAPESITGRCRSNRAAFARWAIWRIMRVNMQLSFNECARPFNRDHGTVMYGIQQIETLITQNATVRKQVQQVTDQFNRTLTPPTE